MHRRLPLVAGLLLLAIRSGAAQEEVPATNLQAYQLLASRIGDSLSSQIPAGDSLRVLLTIRPEGTGWLLQGGVVQELQKTGRIVVVALPAAYQADLSVLETRVAYGNVHTEGLFTGKVADRKVLMSIGAKLVDQRSGVITLNREFRETLHDTVQVSAIPTLEDPYMPLTQGTLPPEGFFSSLVEPLVMLGAVAVAVYLLFAVRS